MAYGLKYRSEYYRKSGAQTTINILEKDYSGDVTDVLAAGDPLRISFSGNVEDVYKPTIGTGAIIKLISQPIMALTSDDTLLDLFTDDPMKFIVKVYNGVEEDSSEGRDDLIWQGFLSPDVYHKNYSYPLRSPITLVCNDGLSVLDKISYSQTEGGIAYTGLTTIQTVLTNIFGKLGTKYDNIRMSSDLLIEDTAVSNLFTGLSINNDNYYDEQDVPMSCREVLDSIFGGLGLVLKLRANELHIVDPINLHDTGKGLSYTFHPGYTFTETVVSLGGYLDISNGDIKWNATNSMLDVMSPFNKIKISYDPYNNQGFHYNFNDTDNWDTVGTMQASHEGVGTVTTNGTTTLAGAGTNFINGFWGIGDSIVVEGESARIIVTTPTDTTLTVDRAFTTSVGGLTFRAGQYFLNTTVEYKNWTDAFGFSHFGAVKETENGDAQFFISLFDSGGTITLTIPHSTIKQGTNVKLRLSMDVWLQTKENSLNIFKEEDPAEGVNINQYYLPVSILIGTQYWKNWNFWSTGETGSYLWGFQMVKRDMTTAELNTELEDTKMNNNWTTVYKDIAVEDNGTIVSPTLVNGDITIKIKDDIHTWMVGQVHPNGYRDNIHYVILKNIKVQYIDISTGEEIGNAGIIASASMDSASYRTEKAIDIKCTNGSGSFGTSRGAFSSVIASPIGTNISGLKRSGGNPASPKVNVDLLAQSIISQYNQSRLKITGVLNTVDYLLTLDSYLIKYSDHLGSKAFYIVNGEYDDRMESMQITMVEIVSTRETIS